MRMGTTRTARTTAAHPVGAAPYKRSLFSRITGSRPRPRTVPVGGHATTTRAAPRQGLFSSRRKVARAPVAQYSRKPTIGDKISGALMKLKGTVTGRPGQKAAGTRRMRGTDGTGSTTSRVTTTTRTKKNRRR